MFRAAYKVLRNSRRSIFAPSWVQYDLYRWITPKSDNGPLGAFDTYEAARLFIENLSSGLREVSGIWKVIYEEWEGKKRFWYYYVFSAGDRCRYEADGKPPDGTVFASKVYLLEEVK